MSLFPTNPKISEFEEHARAVRRNLIVTALIVIFLYLSDIKLNSDVIEFIGLKFTNVSESLARKIIIGIVIYHLLHFIWLAWDHAQSHILQLTGLSIPLARSGATVGGHEYEAGVNDQSQSTLYSWWTSRVNKFQEINKMLDEQIEQLTKQQKLESTLNSIKSHLEGFDLEKQIISKSLFRFEKRFRSYTYSQRIRWFLFEVGIPISLGSIALGLAALDYYATYKN
ncbi:hypothetical protein KW410_07815 [Vibrio fluvialis]|nr:hypothetical protein [Vibrio fluvialis]